jgi:hypothetical protein
MEARRESADSPYQLRSHRPYRTRRLRGGRRSKVKPSTCLKLAGDRAHRRRGWTVAGRGNPLVPSFPWAMLLHVSYCYWSYHGQTLLWPCTQQPTIPRYHDPPRPDIEDGLNEAKTGTDPASKQQVGLSVAEAILRLPRTYCTTRSKCIYYYTQFRRDYHRTMVHTQLFTQICLSDGEIHGDIPPTCCCQPALLSCSALRLSAPESP